jgi:hypothetical protein
MFMHVLLLRHERVQLKQADTKSVSSFNLDGCSASAESQHGHAWPVAVSSQVLYNIMYRHAK